MARDRIAKLAAREILEDTSRVFISSPLIKLETLPKAVNKGSREEVAFLEFAFSQICEWVPIDDALIDKAIQLGIDHQLRNLDAIHAASAIRANVDQFVTTELTGKPYFKAAALRAINLLEENQK